MGHALFFGIARLFAGKVPRDRLSIIPNVTAAQAALARLQLPWQSARFFSVHGRSRALPWRLALQAPLAVIYCDSVRSPAQVAQNLVDAYPAAADRRAAIVEKLGSDNERIRHGTIALLAGVAAEGMSMLVLLPPDAERADTTPELPLGLADDQYLREKDLMTHAEVRAVALSKLRLRSGVLWDLGAGSGSVSIEAAGLCEGIRVYAVEAKPERCEHICENAARAGCTHYEVVTDDIMSAIKTLPAPVAVFVGGGGAAIAQIVTAAFDALRPGGTLVAAAVLEETRSRLMSALPGIERTTCEISVRRSAPLGKGTMMRPQNPVCLFVYTK